jgi:Fe-S cluster assembly protein SufD
MNLGQLPTQTTETLLDALGADVSKAAPAQRFLAKGMPGNKTEQYRHFAIKPLLNRDLAWNLPAVTTPAVGDVVKIRNGQIITAPEGITVEHRSAFEANTAHFDALYFLGHAMASHVIALTIPASFAGDLIIEHDVSAAASLVSYRVAVQIAANTSVNVLETITMQEAEGAFLLYGMDLHLGAYANVSWTRNQLLPAERFCVGTHAISLDDHAQMALHTFDFGKGQGLQLHHIDLAVSARIDTTHLVYALGHARRGNVLHLNHEGRESTSTQLAKYILKDEATGIFDGKIRVGHDAKYASARQNSKALVLSRQSGVRMAAKPQLEIYTDELEASHGSSTGQLDKAELFYLRSRGLREVEAKKILIYAFAHEMIEKITNEAMAKAVEAAFEATHYEG